MVSLSYLQILKLSLQRVPKNIPSYILLKKSDQTMIWIELSNDLHRVKGDCFSLVVRRDSIRLPHTHFTELATAHLLLQYSISIKRKPPKHHKSNQRLCAGIEELSCVEWQPFDRLPNITFRTSIEVVSRH